MKTKGVTTQMKALDEHILMVLFMFTFVQLIQTEKQRSYLKAEELTVKFSFAEKSVECLTGSGQAAFQKFTKEDKALCKKLQDNRAEQDELRRRLEALQNQEAELEKERATKTNIQQRAEEVTLLNFHL